MTIKLCKKCGEHKNFSDFKKNKTKKFGLDSQCKKCNSEYRKKQTVREKTNEYQKKRAKLPHVKEYAKTYRKNYRESEKGSDRINNYFLKKFYGISIEKYKEMFTEQQGRCAICEKESYMFKKKLSVDHNHSTGRIRSLLCHYCNTALGGFMEDKIILNKAIKYLEKFEHKGE